MWIGSKNQDDDYVDELVNASRVFNLVDLSMLHGQPASDCVGMLKSAITDLTPLSKFDEFKMRFSDVKIHAKLALAKKIDFGNRISILFDSFDILFGWEHSWVPSHKNTVIVLKKLVQLCQDNPETTLDVI